MLEPRNTFIN